MTKYEKIQQMKKMKKIIKGFYNGNLNGLTLAEVRTVESVYETLAVEGKDFTNLSSVAKLFEKNNFMIQQKAVGWQIQL